MMEQVASDETYLTWAPRCAMQTQMLSWRETHVHEHLRGTEHAEFHFVVLARWLPPRAVQPIPNQALLPASASKNSLYDTGKRHRHTNNDGSYCQLRLTTG